MVGFRSCSRMFEYFQAVSPVFEWEAINRHLPDQKQLLNKRSELIAKCTHESKSLSINYKASGYFIDPC